MEKESAFVVTYSWDPNIDIYPLNVSLFKLNKDLSKSCQTKKRQNDGYKEKAMHTWTRTQNFSKDITYQNLWENRKKQKTNYHKSICFCIAASPEMHDTLLHPAIWFYISLKYQRGKNLEWQLKSQALTQNSCNFYL